MQPPNERIAELEEDLRRKRRKPTLSEQLASMLLTISREEDGQLVPVISREAAKGMTPKQIIAHFECHHIHLWALGGSNHPTNLQFLPTAEHRERSRKIDTPAAAKTKRLRKQTAEHLKVMAEKAGLAEPKERKPAKRSRRMPCGRDSEYKRKFNGKLERRHAKGV